MIRFGDGVAPTEVQLSTGTSSPATLGYGALGSGDVVLSLGASDQVRIQAGAFGSIEFADGTVNTITQISRQAISGSTTAGDDVITGFATPDRLAGGAGNGVSTSQTPKPTTEEEQRAAALAQARSERLRAEKLLAQESAAATVSPAETIPPAGSATA